jgi:predicted TIM-barrel fold metal-dependent hydrolase
MSRPPFAHVIDVHTHYLPHTLVEALRMRTDLPRMSQGSNGELIEYGEGNVHPHLPAMGDLELRLHDMDAAGIDLAVISTNIPGIDWFPDADGPSIAHDVNDELADVVARGDGRLAALAALPMQDPEAAADELERAVGKGLVGAMIYSNVAGRPLDDERLDVVYETAARLGVLLYIHPTYPLVAQTLDAYALIPTLGFLVDTTTATLRLVFGGVFERHPELKLVLSHAGSLVPQLVGRIDYEAARHDGATRNLSMKPSEALANVYTDCVCVWPAALRSTVEFFGPERVMYGSDYPFWDPGLSFDTLEDCGFPDELAAAIASGNASAVRSVTGGGDQEAASQRENPPR